MRGIEEAVWVLAAFVVGTASADTVTLTTIKDNTLYSTGTTSNGAGTGLYCGRTGLNGGPTVQRSVFAFDVGAVVPPGSTVTSATLTLVLVAWSPNNQATQTHSIYRLLADWGEGESMGDSGMGAPAEPGDATWLHTFYPTDFWAQPGGDFVAVASASASVMPLLMPYTWGSTERMVADVQCWLDEPGCNFGWLMRGNETGLNTAKRFASKEWFDPAERPLLTIEFTPPPPPECPADLDDDGEVAITDLLILLAAWGGAGGDVTGDGVTAIADLLALLAEWGLCGP